MKKKIAKKVNKKSSDDKIAFEKALRSTGLLLPETDDEIEAYNKIYGDTPVELPERLKTTDFLFEKLNKKTKIVSLYSEEESEIVPQLAYAARDGQDTLPEEILKKMSTIKKDKREQKKKNAAKKKK